MKLVLFVASLFFAANAFANAHVGESKSYNLVKGDSTTGIRQTFKSYDEENDQLIVATSMSVMGREIEVSQTPIDAEDAWTHEKAEQVLSNCEQLQGKLESIEVAGNSMDACHLQMMDPDSQTMADLWMGDVPLDGILRMQSEEMGLLEVTDFHWN